ncbi:vitamin K epoxide reductase complex subunit 1 [Exaiptasia diaphana]|uniref:vitamin-K-epoxide reductase (warfarin-sensitive) n=1 Tax=Exaiptasia diaphana TaxID=2652724 RepID=A0A913Y188_EXADI|nr:vitamin K epoxide reductase complex subunit 1 [Exaiptasia diaphana]KXJ29143.1 Vitamin K epoxide reductase complex subunit 1 [Exaiptasia diaphana]
MGAVVWLRVLLCITGLGLSIYALHVETSKVKNKDFKALCDINEHMSCSKVFASKYGTGFGLVEPVLGKNSQLNVPNSIFGILFYTLVCLIGFSSSKFAAFLNLAFSIASCFGSLYLGYILYFVLHDVCLVCLSTYVVNALLLVLNIISFGQSTTTKKSKKE